MPADRLEYDVVVCGSGAAGLTAAVICAQNNLSVLVLEKAELIGGTTAYSMGVPWVPNNHHMKSLGQDDSPDIAEMYLRGVLGDHYEEKKMRAFLESAPEMVRHLENTGTVEFLPIPLPDYHPTVPGARAGRSLFIKQFDGTDLGATWLKLVRTPLPGFVAFKSMQVDLLDLPKMQNATRSWANFRFTIGSVARYALHRIRYGKGANMTGGNALIGRLLKSALKHGVQVWNRAPVTGLRREAEGVKGLWVSHKGKPTQIFAKKAIILATGGFGGNSEWMRKYMPMPEDHISVQPASNTGDGIVLAEQVGGRLASGNVANGVWAPVSVLRDKSGKIAHKYPHFGHDRGKPGSLIVGLDGKRFVDEAAPYQVFVNTMHEKQVKKAWFIGDVAFIRRYGMGLALPAMPYKQLIRDGYLVEAPTIVELAQKISVDPTVLANTIERFNAAAITGVDPEFGRGSNIYDHSQGDWEHNPPNLRPLRGGPFYAVALYPGDVSTVLGLTTDEDGRVLDGQGEVVPGLYAVGLDQNTVMRGFYPGGGCGIGPAMTFAYRAAKQIARLPAR